MCRLGWHRSQFLDSTMYVSAHRCNLCLDWVDPAQGAEVDRFRKAVSNGEIRFK